MRVVSNFFRLSKISRGERTLGLVEGQKDQGAVVVEVLVLEQGHEEVGQPVADEVNCGVMSLILYFLSAFFLKLEQGLPAYVVDTECRKGGCQQSSNTLMASPTYRLGVMNSH